MKQFIAKLSLVIGALVISACQGSSNSGSTATTTGSCVYNSSTGTYVNSTTGAACSTATTSSCVVTSSGAYVNTTTGAVCSSSNTYSYGYGSSYGGYTGSTGCTYWTQMYGVYYIPTYYNGQMVCMRAQ